jgi:hypothetical protein
LGVSHLHSVVNSIERYQLLARPLCLLEVYNGDGNPKKFIDKATLVYPTLWL